MRFPLLLYGVWSGGKKGGRGGGVMEKKGGKESYSHATAAFGFGLLSFWRRFSYNWLAFGIGRYVFSFLVFVFCAGGGCIVCVCRVCVCWKRT